jgi:hypothetical protein
MKKTKEKQNNKSTGLFGTVWAIALLSWIAMFIWWITRFVIWYRNDTLENLDRTFFALIGMFVSLAVMYVLRFIGCKNEEGI